MGAVRQITNVSGSGLTLVTPSVTPNANELLMLAVESGNHAISSVTGCGLTWTFVVNVLHTNSVGGLTNMELWKAQDASPTSGAITITFSGDDGRATAATLAGFANAISLATPHTQHDINTAAISDTLAGFVNAYSIGYSALAYNGASTLTAGAGMTALDVSKPSEYLATEYALNNTLTWTLSGADTNWSQMSVEIKMPAWIDLGFVSETDTPFAVTPELRGFNLGFVQETLTVFPISFTTPIVPTFTGREPNIELGCGSYKVMLTERGGINPIAYLPFNGLSWSRTVDTASTASVTLPVTAAGPLDECCAALFRNDSFDGVADSWSHEISIIRNGKLVWVGPITGMSGNFEQVRIDCRDLYAWFDKRLLPVTRDIVSDISGLFKVFAQDALDPDPSPNINLKGYALNTVNRRVIRKEDYIKASTLLNELGKDSLDFTMVNRDLVFGNLDILAQDMDVSLALPQYGIVDGNWEKRGIDMATKFTLTGQPPGGATKTIAVQVGGTDEKYGLVEEVASESFITVQAFLLFAARSRLEFIKRPPRYIDVTLAPKAPFTIDQLVAGFLIDVGLEIGCFSIKESMRVHELSVSFSVADNGEETETPTLTIVPKGQADVGFGFETPFSEFN